MNCLCNKDVKSTALQHVNIRIAHRAMVLAPKCLSFHVCHLYNSSAVLDGRAKNDLILLLKGPKISKDAR